MSIKADIFTDACGNIMMQMKGHLSFEILPLLRDEFLILTKNNSSQLIIDFKNVLFVGSSGIGNFIELINTINKDRVKIRLLAVSAEFKRVFKLYKLENEEKVIICKESLIFEREDEGDSTTPPAPLISEIIDETNC